MAWFRNMLKKMGELPPPKLKPPTSWSDEESIWPGYFIIKPKMPDTIPVPKDQLMGLLELAEESLYTRHSEFSDNPTDEQRELMLSLYRQVGKEVPPFFARIFGWRLESDE